MLAGASGCLARRLGQTTQNRLPVLFEQSISAYTTRCYDIRNERGLYHGGYGSPPGSKEETHLLRGTTRTLAAGLLALSLLVGCSTSAPPPAPQGGSGAPAGGGTATGAEAPAGNSTIDRIVKKGEITIGMGTTFPPWGYYNDKHELVGYDVDVAKELAKDLGVKPVFVDTTNNNRIPYLITGKVDITIAVFASTPERAKTVAFTEPYAPYFLVMATKKGLNIHTADDLKAQLKNIRLGTTKGTTSDTYLTALLPGANFTRYENPTDLFLAMKQDKIDVGVEGYDGLAVFAKQNAGWEVQASPPLKMTDPTFGVRRGDQDYLNWLNLWIREFTLSGRNAAIYEKNFGVTMPKFMPSY